MARETINGISVPVPGTGEPADFQGDLRRFATDLPASYALKVAPDIIGSDSKRATFNRLVGSTAKGGFESHLVDGSGNPVVGGLVVRDPTDTSEGTINWSSRGTVGYPIHLTAADDMTGDGLIGVGISATVAAIVSGIVASQKGRGIGIAPNNTETAKWVGNGDADTGYAIRGGNLGGVWMRADMGNFGYSSGHLVELHGYTGATNGARVLTMRDQSDQEYWYVDPASKQMWLLQGGATPANDHRTTWEHGNGVIQKMHVYSGASSFFGSQIRAQSNTLKFDVAQAAAIGTHTYQTALTAQATGSGVAAIGFMGAAASSRQVISGSRGGNAALASLLAGLATAGLITDSTTA